MKENVLGEVASGSTLQITRVLNQLVYDGDPVLYSP
jgi:hypothetical protein